MKRFKNEVSVGILLLLAGAALVYMSFQVGAFAGVRGGIRVTADFSDASGLVPNADVKLAGVTVGQVVSLRPVEGRARAILLIEPDLGLSTSAVAEVRARSLLGEKYVALSPREGGEPLAEGAVLPDTRIPFEIDQLVTGLGPAMEAISGTEVDSVMGRAGEMIERNGPELEALLGDLRVIAEAGAELSPALRSEVPPLLSDLRAAASSLRRTARRSEALVGRAEAMLGDAETTLARLESASEGWDETSVQVQQLIDDVEPGVRTLAGVAEDSDDLAAQLEEILGNLSEFDRAAVVEILREEGVLVRLRSRSRAEGR